jgi:hypothetical protein
MVFRRTEMAPTGMMVQFVIMVVNLFVGEHDVAKTKFR